MLQIQCISKCLHCLQVKCRYTEPPRYDQNLDGNHHHPQVTTSLYTDPQGCKASASLWIPSTAQNPSAFSLITCLNPCLPNRSPTDTHDSDPLTPCCPPTRIPKARASLMTCPRVSLSYNNEHDTRGPLLRTRKEEYVQGRPSLLSKWAGRLYIGT